jgi:hypothetical protein
MYPGDGLARFMFDRSSLISYLPGTCRLLPVVSGPRAESVLIPERLWSRPIVIEVTNGGPVDEQRQALDEQFPPDDTDYVLDGSDVLKYFKVISYLFPEVKTEFNDVSTFANCGVSHGVFDARFYVNRNLTSGAAAAVLIVTSETAANLAEIGLECIVHYNGGPTGTNLSPQVTFFKYTTTAGTYYVMLAATNQASLDNFYRSFTSRGLDLQAV